MTKSSRTPKRNLRIPITRRKLRIIIMTVLALALCFAAADIFLLAGRAKEQALVRIPANASSQQLRDTLAKYYGDSYAAKVARLTKLRGTDLTTRHGAYMIEAGMTPVQAMRRLTSGPQHPLTVTINGFRQAGLLQQKLAQKFDFSTDSIAKAMGDQRLLEKYGLTPEQSMALFLNDSYEFYWNASPADIIEKTGAHYLEVWNDKRRSQAAALGLTPAEIMTVASIADEETNATEEKGAIGRLYINRLKLGMPLQADPTVRYAVGDFTIKRVTREMTRRTHPYNTYVVKGLPPGPIRTTSVETLDAILNSTPHEYIYMCAKADFSGRHEFAKTYSEHQVNARRYKRELDRRGIH